MNYSIKIINIIHNRIDTIKVAIFNLTRLGPQHLGPGQPFCEVAGRPVLQARGGYCKSFIAICCISVDLYELHKFLFLTLVQIVCSVFFPLFFLHL